MNIKSRFVGCLLGGATGDALGYPVEFMNRHKIRKAYGSDGITAFHLENGKALISDDTQMTLFTAAGLLEAAESLKYDQETCIYFAYQDWYHTQRPQLGYEAFTNLYHIRELHKQRAPGSTCLHALAMQQEKRLGSIETPINQSKGCGGVMRVAPIGLLRRRAVDKSVAMLGAQAAAITHGHPLGFLPAAALAELIHRITFCKEGDANLKYILELTLKTISAQFEEMPFLADFLKGIEQAICLLEMNLEDHDAIHLLGDGWVAEEAFAIAVYSCLKYSKNFKKALICAVNHDGDSDSTGAIAGNIMGAYLGVAAVEKAFSLKKLELRECIEMIAEKLYKIGAY